MAITTTLTDRARQDFLSGAHLPSHIYKLGLFKAVITGTYDRTRNFYSDVSGDEFVAGGGYATGGNTLTGITFAITSNTASIDWADTSWAASTISSTGAFLYNASQTGSGVLAFFDFGGVISSTNGTFTVTIPAAGTGLIRFG